MFINKYYYYVLLSERWYCLKKWKLSLVGYGYYYTYYQTNYEILHTIRLYINIISDSPQLCLLHNLDIILTFDCLNAFTNQLKFFLCIYIMSNVVSNKVIPVELLNYFSNLVVCFIIKTCLLHSGLASGHWPFWWLDSWTKIFI